MMYDIIGGHGEEGGREGDRERGRKGVGERKGGRDTPNEQAEETQTAREWTLHWRVWIINSLSALQPPVLGGVIYTRVHSY